jgi:hypothetical protein
MVRAAFDQLECQVARDRAVGGEALKTDSEPEHPEGACMTRLPDSLAIAVWVVGSCWALAIAAYALGGPSELILPLTVFGGLTGVAEWVLRKKAK